MKIKDGTQINYTVSGRMQTLTDTWARVRDRYVLEFFGRNGLDEAITSLESTGEWQGSIHGETLYLKVSRP